MHFRLPLIALALTISAFAQERPPQILEVYREFWKPENVAASQKIEVEAAQICLDLKCPHPYLGLESLTGPNEVWFLNGFASSTELKQVGDDYQENTALMEGLDQTPEFCRGRKCLCHISAEFESRSAVESGARPLPRDYRDQARSGGQGQPCDRRYGL